MKNIINGLFGFFQIVKNKLRKIRDYKYYQFYPNNPRHDDVYIVEFPKSGVTWLSTLIANINLQISNKTKENITFYNIHQYVPDIHTSLDISYSPPWSVPNFRFIKSHDVHNKNYNFVIYIIRNPLNVMNSYYIFIKQLGGFNGTFDSFVKHPQLGIEAWLNHVNSWLDRGPTSQKLHLVKYESLVKQPLEEMKKIYENLGLSINDSILLKSINYSDINNMIITEQYHKNNNPNYLNFQFIGQGKITYEINMTNETEKYIYQKVKNNKIYKKLYENF